MASHDQGQTRQPQRIVLVVDDNASIRDMVSWALELDGYEAAEAAEGREALAWMDNAARVGRYPSVILLDLTMPGMDGDAFLAQLQSQWQKARPMPAVIIITATHNVSELPPTYIHSVITKPFHVRDLLDLVRDLTV